MKEILYITSYTNFNNLAHQPRGNISKVSLTAYEVVINSKLKKIQEIENLENPAFLRHNPKSNKMYICTESINDNGYIMAYTINYRGELRLSSLQNAYGKSTCYLTIDTIGQKLLFVNYWDSSLGSLNLSENGNLNSLKGFIKPQNVYSKHRRDHLINRQLESHAHSVVLKQFEEETIAFVPDLGKDVIKQYNYDSQQGTFLYLNDIQSCRGKGPHGPRYLEFHPKASICYVINELSSKISVFCYNKCEKNANKINGKFNSLELIQTISTIPKDFKGINTCGRITVECSGKFVLVSNRGHDSIASYSINMKNGKLSLIGIFSTFGETPRHFQINLNKTIIVTANQDSNNINVFFFNKNNGIIMPKNLTYYVDSPNFVQFINIK